MCHIWRYQRLKISEGGKDAGYFSEALKLIELRLRGEPAPGAEKKTGAGAGADSGLGSGLPVLLR